MAEHLEVYKAVEENIVNSNESVIRRYKTYTMEEALDAVGNGFYNLSLLATLSLALVGLGLELFGFTIIVVGCSCEFQLTLEQKNILNSSPFIGSVLMSYVWGYLSDTRGRRKSLLIALGCGFTAAVLSCLSPNWIVLAVMRVISSSFTSCAQAATYNLLGESCCQRVREHFMVAMTISLMVPPLYFFSAAHVILPLKFSYNLAFLGNLSAWRILSLTYSLPLGCGYLALLLFYESPKFLSRQGRKKEALEVLKKIWVRNGNELSDFPINDIVDCKQAVDKINGVSLLKSFYDQVAPLFQAPYLITTLQLFYLMAIVYSTNTAFDIWLPLIVDSFFKSHKSASAPTLLCESITNNYIVTKNVTGTTKLIDCKNTLEFNTILSGIAMSAISSILNMLMIYFASTKKVLMIVILLVSSTAATCVTFTSGSIITITLFIAAMQIVLCISLISSYLVEIYPTSCRHYLWRSITTKINETPQKRGMASCLGILVSRASSLTGTNIVGRIIVGYCNISFYTWSAFMLTGVIVACFLPPDKPQKRIISEPA